MVPKRNLDFGCRIGGRARQAGAGARYSCAAPSWRRTLTLYLIQILLPLFDNAGEHFPPEIYAEVRGTLADAFGGLTVFSRAPAHGLWMDEGEAKRDDIIVFEVMTPRLDTKWWKDYRAGLEKTFRQDTIVVRAQDITLL